MRLALKSSLPRSPASVRIEPAGKWPALNWRELWEHRELLYFLLWRDTKVRYKQTLLGVAWAALSPLLTMLIFSVIFGLLAKLPSGGVPYPVFTLAALLPWQLFVRGMSAASSSFVANQNLLTKIYFPRLLMPLAGLMTGALDFVIGLVMLFGLAAYYRLEMGWAILTLPLFSLLAVAAALGAGLWLAALNVRFRDVQHVVPLLLQLWMYATPIVYSAELIPPQWRLAYGLNPLVGVVQGFRWALLGQGESLGPWLGMAVVIVAVLVVTGVTYFQRVEDTFADVV